jgi:pimeloyl-ACP methyl ester carboxylesterase
VFERNSLALLSASPCAWSRGRGPSSGCRLDFECVSTSAHAQRRLRAPYPEGWVLFLSPAKATRLIVFVHGFMGDAVRSWRRFPDAAEAGEWWQESDLLFVGYDSVSDSIAGVAARLRRETPRFYPLLPDDLLEIDGTRLRPASAECYSELLLVGHSLGGVVVRLALCDTALGWIEDGTVSVPRPPLLDAEVRLFSPASAGFRAAGWLGLVQACSLWKAVSMQLRRSSAYTDLQPGSQLLVETRRRTEELMVTHDDQLKALRASILWASPDNVVLAERYDSDRLDDSVDGRTHRDVCKPQDDYQRPWRFVETGRHA